MDDDTVILEEGDEEVEFETTTRSEYIAGSYNAIMAVSDIDTALMSKEDAKRQKRIIRKSLRIIDECIGEYYDELYEPDSEDDD